MIQPLMLIKINYSLNPFINHHSEKLLTKADFQCRNLILIIKMQKKLHNKTFNKNYKKL